MIAGEEKFMFSLRLARLLGVSNTASNGTEPDFVGKWTRTQHAASQVSSKNGIDMQEHAMSRRLTRSSSSLGRWLPVACVRRCKSTRWWHWRQLNHKTTKDTWTGPNAQKSLIC